MKLAAGLVFALALIAALPTPTSSLSDIDIDARAPPAPSPLYISTASCPPASYATCLQYEAQALVFTLQGLANRAAPSLLLDLGASNVDFPQSDEHWRAYLEEQRGVAFTTVAPDVCSLVRAAQAQT